jgi:hypothetical protein
MRRIVIVIFAAITAAAGLVTAPMSAGAVPPACLHIYRIYYNSPGTDTGTNASLNAEFVSLHNACTTTRVMTSWKLKDAANHAFTFGA